MNSRNQLLKQIQFQAQLNSEFGSQTVNTVSMNLIQNKQTLAQTRSSIVHLDLVPV